jgi:tripartite-type tricarboxylate transporter receptor subunit TctC
VRSDDQHDQSDQAEKIKVYGVTTKKRVPSLPNVPTMDEAGLKGFEVSVWHALYAPKGTPKAGHRQAYQRLYRTR